MRHNIGSVFLRELKRMTRRIKVHWIFKCISTLVYAYLIYFASSEDTSSIVLPPYVDKLIHFVEFGLLCLLICWLFSSVTIGTKHINKIILAIVITSLYAASDEFHQSFTPNRFVEIFDWLADTAGAVIAGFLWQAITHKRQIKKKLLAMEKTPIKM